MYFDVTSNAKSGYWWRLSEDDPNKPYVSVASLTSASEDEYLAEIQRVVAALSNGPVVVRVSGEGSGARQS